MSGVRAGSSEVRVTATEELRRMLDERGVEWSKGAFPNEARTYWEDMVAKPWNEQRLYVTALLTPEQAIAATLGRGECKDVGWRAVGEFVCSECGHVTDDGIHGTDEFRYCPNCGRRVVDE